MAHGHIVVRILILTGILRISGQAQNPDPRFSLNIPIRIADLPHQAYPPALTKLIARFPMRIQLASAFVILTSGAVQAQEPAAVPAAERSAFDFTHCWGGCKAGCNSEL